VPPAWDDKSDCPGRILNDDGSVLARFTESQEDLPPTKGNTGESPEAEVTIETDVPFSENAKTGGSDEPASELSSVPPSDVLLSTVEPSVEVGVSPRPIGGAVLLSVLPTVSEVINVPVRPGSLSTAATVPNSSSDLTRITIWEDEFGRDTCVVNEVAQMIEEMAKPWSAYRAFEGATARFPNIDHAALRLTVLAVLMGQCRCVNRLTTAGMMSGPRRDEDGSIYLELNNACADDYRNSY